MPIVLSGSYTKIYNQNGSSLVAVSGTYAAKNSVEKHMGYDAIVLTHGNFSRASSGSVLLGSTASVGWANPNQRRLEDRGSGLYTLLEGERQNILAFSRNMAGATWANGSLATTLTDTTTSPDGTTSGDRSIVSSSGYGKYRGALTLPNNGTYVMSFWAKHPVSSGFTQYGIQDGASQGVGFLSAALNTTWARLSNVRKLTGGGQAYYVPGDGRTAGDITARDLDFDSDLHQWEAGTFPSSPIVNSSTTLNSRSADVLTFNAGDVPDFVRNGVISFDVLPYFSSTETTESLTNSGSQQLFALLSFGDNDFFAITGSKIGISASTGFPSGVFTSSALTWNRHQKITITLDSKLGVINFSTLTSSNTFFPGPWTWANSGLQIGAVSGSGARPFFGQISNIRTAPPYNLFDLSQGGSFSRTTSGSYFIASPTDGTTAFLAWANPNERRMEDRGDGSGRMLLLEGTRTNAIAYSEDFSNAFWTLDAGSSRTVVGGDPDGGSGAYRLTCSSGKFTVGETAGSLWSGYVATSLWVRATSGSSPHNTNTFRGVDGRVAQSGSVGSTWERYTEVLALSTASQQTSLVPVDGRDWSAVGGVAAAAKDHRAWGAQRENNAFPSSYIYTSGSAAARGADLLTYNGLLYQYPASFHTRGFRFTYAPDYSSEEHVLAQTYTFLFSFNTGGGNDSIRLEVVGGVIRVRAVTGAVSKCLTDPITFSRGQPLTIEVRPNAGTITIGGATTGNGTYTGTAWTWGGTTIYVGTNVAAAGNAAFGRFGRYIEIL